MSNSAFISRNNEPLTRRSYMILGSWNSRSQHEVYVTRSNIESIAKNNMDATSPNTPTSAVSSGSSDSSLTPRSPTSPLCSVVWGISRTSNVQTSIPKFNTPSIQYPVNRKATLQYILASPIQQSFAEKMTRFRQDSTLPTIAGEQLQEGSKVFHKATQTSDETDQDTDISMLSPSTGEALWQSTTTSPILGRLVGVPLVKRSDSTFPQNDTSSGRHSTNTTTATMYSRRKPGTSHEEMTRSECLPLRSRSPSHGTRIRKNSQTRSERHSRSREQNESNSSSRPRSYSRTRPTRKSRSSSLSQPPKLVIPDAQKAHLKNSIQHLGVPLVPLISVTTGQPHPQFPRSILQYHLLTHDQLDSLSRWYHQTIDNTHERVMYPAVIERPWVWTSEQMQQEIRAEELRDGAEPKELDLSIKRRRFGRFIGLRGCESPDVAAGREVSEESIDAKMEREWKAALRRAEEEEQMQEKMWRGRW